MPALYPAFFIRQTPLTKPDITLKKMFLITVLKCGYQNFAFIFINLHRFILFQYPLNQLLFMLYLFPESLLATVKNQSIIFSIIF